MANRGRPRHPDILTPREWEVLELLRSGASNAQIAARLSITERTVKFHVSEILSKLGVGSREEAARIALPERRRWWAAWPLWARIAGAATMAAAAAGLALLAWGVVRTGGPTDAQQPPSAPKQGLILTSAENPVPWTDLPASSNARPFTIPGVPPCQAANLIFDLLSAGTYNNGAERSWWDVMVRNKGAPCFVGPTLDASFADADRILSVSPERVGYHVIYLENGPQYPGISNPAEGFTYNGFSEYLTLQNPNSTAETVAITLFTDNTIVQVSKQLQPHSRTTVSINSLVVPMAAAYPTNPVTQGYEVSMDIRALSGTVVAERPLYFNWHGDAGGTDVLGYTGE